MADAEGSAAAAKRGSILTGRSRIRWPAARKAAMATAAFLRTKRRQSRQPGRRFPCRDRASVRAISAFSSAPARTISIDSHSHNISPITAPRAP